MAIVSVVHVVIWFISYFLRIPEASMEMKWIIILINSAIKGSKLHPNGVTNGLKELEGAFLFQVELQ